MRAMRVLRTVKIMLLFSLLAACGRQGASSTRLVPTAQSATATTATSSLSTSTPKAPTATSIPTAVAPSLNPLTGLPLENSARLEQRPILIKVSNFPRNNRPQWGLSYADIVFEHYAEGGLTRFSALFYGSEAERVGPIRSARFIDLELVRMYGAIFAYGSADYRVRDAIAKSDFAERAVTEYPARCPPMCRFDPSNFNHLVSSTEDLREYLGVKGIPDTAVDLTGMEFEPEIPPGGEPGTQLEIHYSVGNFHRWVFDSAVGVYQRWQEQGADEVEAGLLVDRLTGNAVSAANVILVVVPHTYITQTPEFVRIELQGEGRAIAFRDGQAFKIRWVRPEGQGILQFETVAGVPFALRPGTTWVELVNTSSEIEQRSAGAWWVRFHIP
jgi:hypothetical protein